jgi:hypothetical protein
LSGFGGTAGQISGEEFVASAVDRQREAVMRATGQIVDDAIARFADRVAIAIEQLYADALAEFRRQQVAWRSAQLDAIERESADGESRAQWDERRARAIDLGRSIRMSLPDRPVELLEVSSS